MGIYNENKDYFVKEITREEVDKKKGTSCSTMEIFLLS